MKRFALAGLGLAIAVPGFAQSRSSFQDVSLFDGINISNTSMLDWTVTLSATPKVTYLGHTYTVTDVFGFWLLDDNNDFSATGTNPGLWSFHSNYAGTGGIAGFKTNPNTGITPGLAQSFHFNSITGQAEGRGIHVRFAENLPGGGNTIYLKDPGAVPEPATLAVLGGGLVAFLKRRRR